MMVKRKIKWVKAIEEEQKKETSFGEKAISALGTSLSTLLYALIFVCATTITINDIYECGRPTADWFFVVILVVYATGFAFDLCSQIENKWAKYAPVAVLGLGIVGFSSSFWGAERAKNLLDGILAFFRIFIGSFNTRYGTTIRWYNGNPDYINDGVYYLVFVALFLLLVIAKLVKKNHVMMIMPVAVIAVELMVGKAPGRWPFFLLMAGVLLACSRAWDKPDMQATSWETRDDDSHNTFFAWIISSFLMILVCGLILIFATEGAQKLVDKHSGKVTSDFVKFTESLDLEQFRSMETLLAWLERMFKGEELEFEAITNNSPDFTYEPIMEVTLSELPAENIYLKGFCGDFYENCFWERGNDRLAEACEEYELVYYAIDDHVTSLTIDKIMRQYGVSELEATGMTRELMLSYVDFETKRVYAPYFAKVNTEGIVLISDGCFEKGESLEEIAFTQWNQGDTEFTELAGAKGVWEDDYEKFVVDYYLDMPGHFVYVNDVARELEKLSGSKTFWGEVELNGEMRLHKANLVSEWLKENTEYSMDLPAIENGMDPIDYFLGVSKTGYCMHYASAATMILREMGVPARYVSGYIVHTEDFTAADGAYKATVLDSQAHAWVEIFLDEIGWVPVEMTRSYPAIGSTQQLSDHLPVSTIITGEYGGSIQMVTKPSDESMEVPSEQSGLTVPEDENSESLSEEAESDETSEETSETEGLEDESEETSEGASGEETSEESTESHFTVKEVVEEAKEYGKSDMSLITLAYILGAVIIVVIVAVLMANTHRFFRAESANYKRIKKQIKNKNYKNAILEINNAIYRKLEFKKMIEPGSGDDEFENVLKKFFTKDYEEEDWEKYMQLVKAANFSEKEFTKEDLKFCYKLYRDAIYKDEVW